ncbi:MAG: c-type cytochrome [Gammaproteobacteria bacterium]|nr:c-type cytochrome [Gammaproteobacteria bacterium]
MLFRFTRIFVALTASLLLLPSLALAADAEHGEILFDTCIGCHGSESYNNVYPTYKVPRLVGQWPEYIVAALAAYKDGSRQHPTMQAQAASFSTDDMQDIAAYLASQGEMASADAVGTPPESAATCIACHGANGQSLVGSFPNLAGQHQDYLLQALKDYKSGSRNNIQMAPMVLTLSEADLKALATYYSKQSGLKTFEQ